MNLPLPPSPSGSYMTSIKVKAFVTGSGDKYYILQIGSVTPDFDEKNASQGIIKMKGLTFKTLGGGGGGVPNSWERKG